MSKLKAKKSKINKSWNTETRKMWCTKHQQEQNELTYLNYTLAKHIDLCVKSNIGHSPCLTWDVDLGFTHKLESVL